MYIIMLFSFHSIILNIFFYCCYILLYYLPSYTTLFISDGSRDDFVTVSVFLVYSRVLPHFCFYLSPFYLFRGITKNTSALLLLTTTTALYFDFSFLEYRFRGVYL